MDKNLRGDFLMCHLWVPRLTFFLSLFTVQIYAVPATSLDVKPVRESCITPPCTNSAIFFVHGLFGGEGTWTNEETNNSFPELVRADPDLKQYDIYSVVYTSAWLGQSPAVAQIENELFQKMMPYYLLRHERVVFIAHSLGGNLIRNHVVEI